MFFGHIHVKAEKNIVGAGKGYNNPRKHSTLHNKNEMEFWSKGKTSLSQKMIQTIDQNAVLVLRICITVLV